MAHLAPADSFVFFFCNNGVKFLVPRAWRNRAAIAAIANLSSVMGSSYNHKTTLAGRAMPAIDLLCLVATVAFRLAASAT